MPATVKTFTISVQSATVAVFQSSAGATYVYAPGLDFNQFRERFPDAKRVEFHSDDDSGRFYAMAISDCFDPPVAVIQTGGECNAIDVFCNEFPWSHVSPENLDDYREEAGPDVPKDQREFVDGLHFNDSGQPCDIEALAMVEVRLVRVEA